MKLETVLSRISNTQKKIAIVEKRIARMEKTKQNSPDWNMYDEAELESSRRELKKLNENLDELYKAEKIAQSEAVTLPEILVQFRDELASGWATQDIASRQAFVEEYQNTEHAFNILSNKYGDRFPYLYKLMATPDSTIHRNAMRDATEICENLVIRTRKIVGSITDYHNLHLEIGTHGFGVLNGFIAGTEGNALVESVYCGGYNIQRLHVRVLVKKM